MPSVIQRRNPKKGRRRKPAPPKRLPLAITIPQFSRLTGDSKQTTRRKIKAGKIRSIQLAKGQPYKIPVTELVRLGFVAHLGDPSLSELTI
jgi:hypothetical protein